MSSRRPTVSAVKVQSAGWLGVSPVAGPCHRHGHETPELAKLCALHREQVREPEENIVLLPLPHLRPAAGEEVARAWLSPRSGGGG